MEVGERLGGAAIGRRAKYNHHHHHHPPGRILFSPKKEASAESDEGQPASISVEENGWGGGGWKDARLGSGRGAGAARQASYSSVRPEWFGPGPGGGLVRGNPIQSSPVEPRRGRGAGIGRRGCAQSGRGHRRNPAARGASGTAGWLAGWLAAGPPEGRREASRLTGSGSGSRRPRRGRGAARARAGPP